MFGRVGRKRVISLNDGLGRLIPAGSLKLANIERALIAAIERQAYLAGHGVPSVPTRYVVTMNPADRAWLAPETEDLMARAVESYADRSGRLVVGRVEVAFKPDALVHPGRPLVWAGFAEDDLMIVSSPGAAAEIFAAG